MRFVKKFFGIILCICAFGFTVATEQVERNMQPFFYRPCLPLRWRCGTVAEKAPEA